MTEKYDLKSLIKTFGRHHVKILHENELRALKIAKGEIEFQDWMKDEFSISLALQHICKEIKNLKDAAL